MIWHIGAAPEDVPLRVRTHDDHTSGRPLKELCYLLIRSKDRWYYARTMVPVYPWHEPVAWSQTPRLAKQEESFRVEVSRAYGARVPPSEDCGTWSGA